MWLSGQWFGPTMVERIASAVQVEPSISRRALSRRVCEWLDWRGPGGKLSEVSCRKALAELERRGKLELPRGCSIPQPAEAKASTVPEVANAAEVRASLAELGEVELVLVSSRYAKASSVWKGLMEAHHYLGSGPLCGAQLRYLLYNAEHGWLGGLSFSAATPRLKVRDEWIGWSEAARRANLSQVVCNSRFLILPTVQVPNLASHALSLAVSRLGSDWQERYGYAPVLLETFVDGQRFAGTCYQAANWRHLGESAGRCDGYANGRISSGPKQIYVYPLVNDFQERLCREPADKLSLRPEGEEANDWAEEEFGGARLFDGRLRTRLSSLARDFFARPGELVPQACGGSVAKVKAAYRFFANSRFDIQDLLKGHVEATAGRVSQHEVVLAVQDTMTMNYSAHPGTSGLGPINTKSDRGVGLILHDTMAFSTEGTPLGLLDAQCWARDPEQAGKKAKRKQLPIEEKESIKWLNSYRSVAEVQGLCPDTMLVSVGDREADIHELFHEAQQSQSGVKLLVRSERSRNRKIEDDEHAFLWEKMPAEDLAGHLELEIPRCGSRAAREAKLAVRYAAVTLKCPQGKDLDDVSAWAVYAREVDPPPEVKQPLEWMLLTTVPVTSFEEAVERLRWYALRWGIEIYHRVLKSGCRIQDRQLNAADRIESCFAIDLVVAWRIFWLVKQGRETPDIPCDVFFEEDEWKVLYAAAREESPPEEPPTLREAVRMTAKLGGFLGRKSDGEPGTITLWRGLVRLDNIVFGYKITQRHIRARDGP